MPSKSARGSGDDIEVAVAPKTDTEVTKPGPEPTTLQSQEYLRDQLAETEVATSDSMLLGSAYDSATEGGSRGDSFLVGGRTMSSNLGRTTTSLSGTDLGSGRGDSFKVGDRTMSSNLGRTTTSLSGTDLGSGRGDSFKVGDRTLSSDLGRTTTNLSGTDLGSGRGDEFKVGTRTISSDIGRTTTSLSGTDLGSGRGDEGPVVAAKSAEAVLDEQIATNTVSSVSLPLMSAAAVEIEETGSASPELIEAAAEEAEYQAEVLTPEDIPAGLLEALPEDTVLRFAFSPEDMEAINLQAEHDAVKEVADVFTLNNPTPETMKHVLESGQFEDLIWSGHGTSEGLWITDTDGTAKLLKADDVGALLQDTGVKDVLLNVCDGGDKTDNALGRAGMNVFSNKREIDDATAVNAATQFAENGNLLDIDREWGDGSRLMWERKANAIDRYTAWRDARRGGGGSSTASEPEVATPEAATAEVEQQAEQTQTSSAEADTADKVEQVLDGQRSDANAVEEVATAVKETKKRPGLFKRLRTLRRRFRRR